MIDLDPHGSNIETSRYPDAVHRYVDKGNGEEEKQLEAKGVAARGHN